MKGAKQFFEELREGEEYLSLMASREVYFGIDHELREQMYCSTIRQKNSNFKEDANHQQLVKNVSKAKNALTDYEYIINQGEKAKK
jgi:hypothetical protein